MQASISSTLNLFRKSNNIVNEFISEVQKISGSISIKTNVNFRLCVSAVHIYPESEIVECALKACETVKKKEAILLGYPTACDMHVFVNEGIDKIVMGAGNIYDNFAYGSNEFIKTRRFRKNIKSVYPSF